MAELWTRLVSRLHGEIPADTLESYRRASLAVHDLLHQADSIRMQAKLEGKSAWDMPKNIQAEMLCAWNAFVLQSLGNEFLDADYRDKPATKGFVPPITSDQVMRFYTQVEGWLNRAQQAHSNPDYRLDVQVPADLPPWSEVEPCPNSHLHGMLHAMNTIRDHAAGAMQFLGDTPPEDPDRRAQYNQIQQIHAAATTKARYSEDLHGTDPSKDMHERVEPHIKECVEGFYRLGQLVAMPSLAVQKPLVAPTPIMTTRKPAMPGDPAFDPWCLSDPDTRDAWMRDPKARQAIKTLWDLNPDPAKTLRIQAEIDEAVARGDIRRATDRNGRRLGHFFCCPWAPIYEVVRPLKIGSRSLTALQQFVFDVTAEGTNLGNKFKCEIMVGNFQPTDQTEYGDPNEPPDH